MSLFEDRYDGPEMTWGADIRLSPQQTLKQLVALSLLMRMVQQRKDPLPEPPPLNNDYPD